MCTAVLYFVFACLYVIACPNTIHNHTANHQQGASVKNYRQGDTGHSHHFKFLSRPRLILSKKIPLPIIPFTPEDIAGYSASVQAVKATRLPQALSKAKITADSNLLFCRWLV